MWRQKSHETWLKDGDRNTRYFHTSAVVRCRHNNIDAIRGADGTWLVNFSDIREFAMGNFTQLFSEEDTCFPMNLDNLISPILSDLIMSFYVICQLQLRLRMLFSIYIA